MTDAQKIVRLENDLRLLSMKVNRQTIDRLSKIGSVGSALGGGTSSGGNSDNGLPVGGTANQVLEKIDGTDYNAQWADPAAGGDGLPTGGTSGQYLEKIDGTDFNAQWQSFVEDDLMYARYRNETGQSADATVDTLVQWDTTDVQDAPYSLASNVITVADDAVYLLGININLSGTTTILRYGGIVTVYIDGVPIPNIIQGGYVRGDSGHRVGQITGTLPLTLTAGQTIEIYIKRIHSLSTNIVIDTGTTFSLVQMKGLRGGAGPPGVAGPSGDITWEGPWSAGTYTQNQAVEHGGNSYVVVAASTTEEPPHVDWELMAQKGDDSLFAYNNPTVVIEDPSDAERIPMFKADQDITVTKIFATLQGTLPDVDWTLRFDSDLSAVGTEVVTGGTNTTSTSTGDTITVFNDATIPAGSHVWIETTAASGVITYLVVTVIYTID